MRATDALAVAVTTLLGAATGWILAGALGAAVGAITSGLVALLGVLARVRPGLIAAVLVGTMAGILIGSSVVKAICLPSSCSALEVFGGVTIGMLSFVGVGLVAALVTRSFDEYNERMAAGLPETSVGCESPEDE